MEEILLHWVLATICLMVTSWIVKGFNVTSWISAFFAALVLSLLNALLWPLFVILTFPVTILTFGLFLFVINAIVLKIGAALVPGFKIIGFMPAVIGGIVLAVVGYFTRMIFL